MSDFDAFAAGCELASRNLRALPADLRTALADGLPDQVATPLAAKLSKAARGPWRAVLATATKATTGTPPAVVIGGGGLAGRVVFGSEFGGGGRVASVTRRRRRGGSVAYRRNVTAQFRTKHPFIFPTLKANEDWVTEQVADITDNVLKEV